MQSNFTLNQDDEHEAAAIRRGRQQLNHMQSNQHSNTTIDKDNQQRFSKKSVSPMRTSEGKVLNKGAGNNDLASIIKS